MLSRITRGRAAALTLAAAALVTVPLVASAAMPAGHQSEDRRHDNTKAARHAVIGGQARNVILLIGDGMGDSEITIARNYAVGAAGRLAMDTLPMTGAYTTYSVAKDDPSLPDYVPDSAATGTGWATGHKSYDGAISVLPSEKPVPTILELAKRAGYRTGDVSTAELTDATPAVLASHVTDRGCKGPENMANCPTNDKVNGGKGSIAEQMTQTRPDLMLGGAATSWDQTVQAGPYAGKTVREQAVASGYQVVTTKTEMNAASDKKPILGLFAPTNMDLEWVGPTPTHEGTDPATCEVNAARPVTQPHLVDMTNKALSVLSKQTKHSKKGFFLQVEGASIDKQDHAANPCGQIGETVAFDSAVKAALAYQKHNPDTLVVVTADHGHTSQIVEAGSTTPGVTATLVTVDGAEMTINYATAEPPASQEHTGTQVRIAARGPQAANVLGVTDPTDLFFTVRRALGLH
jgi:alkaline phosphatase